MKVIGGLVAVLVAFVIGMVIVTYVFSSTAEEIRTGGWVAALVVVGLAVGLGALAWRDSHR